MDLGHVEKLEKHGIARENILKQCISGLAFLAAHSDILVTHIKMIDGVPRTHWRTHCGAATRGTRSNACTTVEPLEKSGDATEWDANQHPFPSEILRTSICEFGAGDSADRQHQEAKGNRTSANGFPFGLLLAVITISD